MELDSWEDHDDDQVAKIETEPMNGEKDIAENGNANIGGTSGGAFTFNANAKPFTFNPGASSFTPSWTKKTAQSTTSPPQQMPVESTASTEEGKEVSNDNGITEISKENADVDNHDKKSTNTSSADKEAASGNGLTGKKEEKSSVESVTAAVKSLSTKDDSGRSSSTNASTPTSSSTATPSTPTTPTTTTSSQRLAEEEAQVLAEEADQREHLNVVFIGHVDAGKSTIGGQILYLTGCVDERTIQKYEREAKEKNRESWYMAYIMDTNDEERAKGKTVEVGRAHFETDKKRYTILDAPGHKNYVPNMIGGAAQADVGVLVIAARRGEFETGFERGGQTREHAQLAKTLGIAKLIVVVNKMDDQSVQWNKERYDEVITKMSPFLKSCGYNLKRDVIWCPISGLKGTNIKDPVPKDVCDWYDGGSLFNILDGLNQLERDAKGPFRMPILDKYRDLGTNVMGKSESGTVKKGDTLLVMPNKVDVKVAGVYREADEIRSAGPGENLRLRLTGIEEEDVQQGYVVCSSSDPIVSVTEIDAQVAVLELLEHKAIFTAGYKAVFHIHTATEECEVMVSSIYSLVIVCKSVVQILNSLNSLSLRHFCY